VQRENGKQTAPADSRPVGPFVHHQALGGRLPKSVAFGGARGDGGRLVRVKSPEKQLDDFIAKYSPEIGMLTRAALAKMRARLPGAIELVYDNYNALAARRAFTFRGRLSCWVRFMKHESSTSARRRRAILETVSKGTDGPRIRRTAQKAAARLASR
jgi:hypothetical protein